MIRYQIFLLLINLLLVLRVADTCSCLTSSPMENGNYFQDVIIPIRVAIHALSDALENTKKYV